MLDSTSSFKASTVRPGRVYLIGAGPGDPGLLTVKGQTILREADAIVYDYLVNSQLLKAARPDCELIYVGKKAGHHTIGQTAINALLVELALAGKTVARLKGGDPFVFGRGGEEAQTLKEAGIRYEIVPGISSAIAVAAYAGIPVTHRDFTSSFTVITGHEDPKRDTDYSRLDWSALARVGGTLVFLMGVGRLTEISHKLVESGLPIETPVAVVEWGTTPQQKTVSGTLADIAEIAAQSKVKPPAITIIGQVASLRPILQWFDLPEVRPLLGKRIIISDTVFGGEYQLTQSLQDLGAEVVQFPAVRFTKLEEIKGSFTGIIWRLSAFAGILFTNPTQVEYFWRDLFASHYDSRELAGTQIVSIGANTKVALAQHGIVPDFNLTRSDLENLDSILKDYQGKSFLYYGTDTELDTLMEKWRENTIKLHPRDFYAQVVEEAGLPGGITTAQVGEWLTNQQIDLIYFANQTSLDDFATVLQTVEAAPLSHLLADTAVIVAPRAVKRATELGLHFEVGSVDEDQLLGEIKTKLNES